MKCFLDLDGVLVNFYSAMCASLNHSGELPPGLYNLVKIFGVPREELTNIVKHRSWWSELPWMPDGREILSEVEYIFGRENVCILSSPWHSSEDDDSDVVQNCMAGKYDWVCEHIPDYRSRFLFGPAKDFNACATTYLIDDFDDNFNGFLAANGRGVLVPRVWNSAHADADSSFKIVRDYLHSI